MIALVQRVTSASVTKVTNPDLSRGINLGFLIHLGVAQTDSAQDVDKLVNKISKIRLFSDEAGKLNLDLASAKASILLISQFTLIADYSSGNRPSFLKAAPAAQALELYQMLIEKLKQASIPCEQGFFGEYMTIKAIFDGPVTIILDSAKL